MEVCGGVGGSELCVWGGCVGGVGVRGVCVCVCVEVCGGWGVRGVCVCGGVGGWGGQRFVCVCVFGGVGGGGVRAVCVHVCANRGAGCGQTLARYPSQVVSRSLSEV